MSYCVNLTRNRPHLHSIRYLQDTARKLRCLLQCWIANILCSGWMYFEYIKEAAHDDGLLFPLGYMVVDHKGIKTSQILIGH